MKRSEQYLGSFLMGEAPLKFVSRRRGVCLRSRRMVDRGMILEGQQRQAERN